jgi:hypothetical protein
MHYHKFVLKRMKFFVEMSFLISDRTSTFFDEFLCKTFLRSLKAFTIKVSFEAKTFNESFFEKPNKYF